jgi:transposase-like protein
LPTTVETEPILRRRRYSNEPQLRLSSLIVSGLNIVFVSREHGHANPNITLEVYAHLFERADHAHAAKEALEASYAATLGGGS